LRLARPGLLIASRSFTCESARYGGLDRAVATPLHQSGETWPLDELRTSHWRAICEEDAAIALSGDLTHRRGNPCERCGDELPCFVQVAKVVDHPVGLFGERGGIHASQEPADFLGV
jgi:hypothetical protein